MILPRFPSPGGWLLAWTVMIVFLAGCTGATTAEAGSLRLSEWRKGIAFNPEGQEDMILYLWFYEWNLFDAFHRGENTYGTSRNEVLISQDGRSGSIVSAFPGLKLQVEAGQESADLRLSVTNLSDHDWPDLAAMIPCFNPGPKDRRNPRFSNQKTFFLGPDGLQLLEARQLHYNRALRTRVDREAHHWKESLDPNSRPGDRFPWSFRWPDTEPDARAGLIVRESNDGRWVTGIAWERFLSAQAHNPWECMHLSVHLGPLKREESREIRGKIYLLQGTREELLERYFNDFGDGQ